MKLIGTKAINLMEMMLIKIIAIKKMIGRIIKYNSNIPILSFFIIFSQNIYLFNYIIMNFNK